VIVGSRVRLRIALAVIVVQTRTVSVVCMRSGEIRSAVNPTASPSAFARMGVPT